MVRRTLHFAGHVQGVGFRFVTLQIANALAVKGCVRNLPDGRVQVVLEGTDDEANELIKRLRAKMEGYIESMTDERAAATGEFASFEIRR